MNGEAYDTNYDYVDLLAKFTTTAGPLKVLGGIGDLQFSAEGDFMHVGGDLTIGGAGHNRIWLEPDNGTTVAGSIKVAGPTGDPDWFVVWSSLTVGKDVSVNLGGGANSIEFGTQGGTTSIGGNLILTTGNTSDEITLDSLTVNGSTTINSGAGADSLFIVDGTVFNGLVAVNLGAGEDVFGVAHVAGAGAPVTFNAIATVNMGAGNDTLMLGLDSVSHGGDANSRVVVGLAGHLTVNGGLNLNWFDDEAGQFDPADVSVNDFTDPT